MSDEAAPQADVPSESTYVWMWLIGFFSVIGVALLTLGL